MREPLSVPLAVPLTRRSFAHVALNNPLARAGVCSVTFHVKSVHVLAEGMMFADDQVPISALTPLEVGASVLWCSKPMQPAVQVAISAKAIADAVLLMVSGP
jgi:hypothetical protein